ncbi:MAG: mono/diheme cytochrome c family protein [Saprospiraceae bacterium]|jgi:mono/diheme cytochrome c family protein
MALGMLAFIPKHNHIPGLDENEGVALLLKRLGSKDPSRGPNMNIEGVSAQVGEDIVKQGFSKGADTKKSKRQSKHFVCTSCHNTVQEDPDLAVLDPQARLEYAKEKGIPFLQGTTLYGAVNRETFYNDDYVLKYGDLVDDAKNDIRGAIQLCAKECAQGRTLKDWELESILAYLWKIEIKVGDLNLNEEEKEKIENAIQDNSIGEEAITIVKSKYAAASPATFVYPPEDRAMGSGLTGVPSNGKLIYEQSCLHCHYKKEYSFLHLDSKKMSFTHLKSKIATYHRHSLYQVTRWGTYSKMGKKSYMPRYTLERMSEQQLTDLRSYIEEQADIL